MIFIDNLLKEFGSTTAVDIKSLHIEKGDIFGLVGNNGAGKTTLLRLMLDLLKPEKGHIISQGRNVYQSDHWKKYTGSFIDNNFLIEFLTPDEYLNFIGFLTGLNKSDINARIESFNIFSNGKGSDNEKYIRTLSSGEKQKVGIIGAMISNPEVLILDEPFNYLDPTSQISLKQILKRHHDKKTKTIIISSHSLTHISDICSRVALMEKGKIIKDCENTIENMKYIESYFNSQLGVS